MMITQQFLTKTLYAFLALSLFGVCFASYKIICAKYKTESALKDWDSQQLNNKVSIPMKADGAKINPTHLKEGDVIGKLTFSSLQIELPIIQGTETEDLEKGVGHYITSALPGEKDNVVLAGHRDGVFRGLDHLKEKDHFDWCILFF